MDAASLISDRPIEHEDDDRLERGGLVSAIVGTIARAPETGFVIGLAGPWGEGKSSVLNMTAERVRARDLAHVVQFNPWMFTGADELLERFFSELAATLQLGDSAGQRAAQALDGLGQALGRLGWLPFVGNAVEAGGTAADGAARLLQAGTSLHDRREDVAAAIADLDRPILVIVDDLDRLRSNEEIAEMVRLIRLVGDLPRVTYLLAYEREVVARALGDGDPTRGEAYLEKIVQAPFELPPVRRDLLDRLLTKAMDAAIGNLEGRRFDAGRFESLQIAGFRELFRNVRDVRRFASALPAVIAALDDEVELSDVLALEALRTLEPRVFALIAANVEAVTALGDDAWQARGRVTTERTEAAKAMVRASRRSATIVAELLRELFPAAERHLGGTTYSRSFAGVWRREGRVASREILTVYLERGLPSDQVSAGRVQEALAMLDDRDALERLVAETDEDALIRLLSRLEDFEGHFDLADPAMTVEVLAAAAIQLRPRDRQPLQYDASVAISRLLVRILRGREPEDVEQIVRHVRWPDLSARAMVVRMVGNPRRRLVADSAADALERELVGAILGASGATLRDEKDLAHLMWVSRQREPEQTTQRLGELIDDPRFLLRWLRDELLEKRGHGGKAYLLPWVKLIERVDSARLAAAANALDDAWVAEHGDELAQEAVRQARHYAADPELAATDYRAFVGEEPDEDESPGD